MLWNLLKKQMEKYGDSWVQDAGEKLSYSELLLKVEVIAKNLKSFLPEKAKCAVFCNRELYSAVAILACFCAGMIPIPVSTKYGEEHCKKIIQLTDPDLVLTDHPMKSTNVLPYYNLIKNKLNGQIGHCVTEKLLDNVVLMMCTSGTSGFPKAAMIQESGLIGNLLGIHSYFKLSAEDVILINRPLYHCAVLTGEFLISIYNGLDVYFNDGLYIPSIVIDLVCEHKITVLCGTQTLFYHLCNYLSKTKRVLPIRKIAISGECLMDETAALLKKCFQDTDIYHVYGLTEASPRVSYLPPALFERYPKSVGFPLNMVTLKITDDQGAELPPNVDGNLMVRSPGVMKGYYHNPKLTEAVLLGGWLRTGDMACIDENGLLYIKGRADDLIIKAGMNIYPAEIENALRQSEKIEGVVAYSIKKTSGQRIGINVQPAGHYANITKRDIMRECEKYLSSYQFPDEINIVEKIYKNASGKTVRKSYLEII